MGVLIAYLLGVLTAVRRKNQDRKHVDHETHKDCKRFPVPLPIVNVPVAQSDQERTKQEKKECREKWKFRGEIGGLIVLTVYAVFTIATWWQVKKSTDAAVRNFQTDERAWIELEPIKPILFAPGSREVPRASFRYEIYPRNVGKTPARDVVMKAQVTGSGEVLGNDASMIENMQDKFLQGKFTDSTTGKPVVIFGSPIPRVLAPNTAAPVPYLLHGQEPQHFSGGQGFYDYLIGRIDYVDQFSVAHWMKFCLFVVNQRGELRYCQYGNDEDRNSPKQ